MAQKEKNSKSQNTRTSFWISPETLKALETLAAKEGKSVSEIIRCAIEKYLNIESYTDNLDFIAAIVRNEINISVKGQTNRLAALINRLTIIAAAGYFANITTVADLIDRDRYSSFEKTERIARRKALLYANAKSSEGIADFLDDEQIRKLELELSGKNEEKPSVKKKCFEDFDPASDDPMEFLKEFGY